MAVLGAIVLLLGGVVGLASTWNAARPIIDPTRRYSPFWLPAMVVTELAPFWLVVHGALLGLGLLLGGWSNRVGRVGAALMVTSILLLVGIMLRTARAVRALSASIDGPVHGAVGRARIVGVPVPTPPGVVERWGVEWRQGLTLDIIRPADDRRLLPVVVYVHGGGWTGGDPQHQARDLYHALALDGWVTLAIRYPFTPEVSVEHQIEQVRLAVAWARSDLADHGVDATHVVLAGGSAGGHLAAMAALVPEGDDRRVDACVPIYAVFDMANRNRTRAHWATIANTVMMATVAEAPERYAAVSPLDQVTESSPPMLVVHGTRDTLVPIAEAEQFVAALQTARRPVAFVRVAGAQHAFDALSSTTSRTTAAVICDWLGTTVLVG